MAGPIGNDTAFKAETPEGIEYTLYPAGLCARFCAYGLDTVFQWILLAAFIIIYYFALDAAAGLWLVLLFRFVLDWFYHVVGELLFRGQTPGKRILGLRVVLTDGSPVSPASSFIRNLIRFIDGYSGFYLIAFAGAALSAGFRRPGDWAAGTLVVYTWQSQAIGRGGDMAWLARAVPAVSGSAFSAPGTVPVFGRGAGRAFNQALSRTLTYEEKQGILMFARRYPLLGPARADEIAAPLVLSLRGVETRPGARPEAGQNSSARLLGIASVLSQTDNGMAFSANSFYSKELAEGGY